MKPLCMKHWDRPRADCPDCLRQRRVQDALLHGVRPERIEKYLAGADGQEKIASDITKLDTIIKTGGGINV